MNSPTAPRSARLGLGLDAGGTQTRWALATPDGRIEAEGHVAGLSGTQLATEAGRADLQRSLVALAQALAPHAKPAAVRAGITGLPDFDHAGIAQMNGLLAEALALPLESVRCQSDIALAWRAAFPAGAEPGYLVYAGTGAIAAFFDAAGELQRAGGRGGILGDEGGGYWIATQALAQVWRWEDETPGGAAERSPMARRLFEALGGSDWAHTRQAVYAGSRGQIGMLALAVAASAEDDRYAAELLTRAGTELARLAQCLIQRHGPRPVVAAGRALSLSPLIEQGLRAALPPGTPLSFQQQLQAHRAAAQLAAQEVTP